MPANISEGSGAQQGVTNCVNQHICIRMTIQALWPFNFYAPKHKFAPCNQGVDIESAANSHY
jgi:hypothetical protein